MFRPGLARQTANYAAWQALSALPPLLMIPLMTLHLSTADYGMVALFSVSVVFFHPLVGLGIGRLAPVWCGRLPAPEAGRRIMAALAAATLSAALFGAGFLLLSLVAPSVLGFPVVLLALAALSHAAQAWLAAGLGRLQAEGRSLHFGLLQLLVAVLNVSVSVVLVVMLDWRWEGRIAGHLAAICAGGAAAALALRAVVAWRLRPSRAEVGRTFRAELLPLLPYGVGATILAAADRLLAAHWLDLPQVGLYAAASQLALPILLLGEVLNRALSPRLIEHLGRGDPASRRTVRRAIAAASGCIVLAGAGAGVVLFALSGWLLGPDFRGAMEILPFLLLANVAGAIAIVLAPCLLAAGHPRLLSGAMAVAMLGLAVACAAFYPQVTAVRLAQCFAAANLLFVLVVLGLIQRTHARQPGRISAPRQSC